MRYRESIKRGMSLLLALVLTVSLIVPAAAADGGSGAELIAAFDKASYSAGETVTVTFTVYGADFDAAGFHVTYDQSSLTYQSVQAGSGFAMPVRKAQAGALELMVESDAVQQPGSDGTVIAAVTFTAVTGGAKTLAFTTGSAAYLERKSAVVYNGYQALSVTTGVAADAAAAAALRRAKADAVAQLEADINSKLEAGVTVAQRELLLRCLQSGRAAIHNAATEEDVSTALSNALARAEEIAAETTLEFPKLTALYDAENNNSTTIKDMYPAFSPDATAYFLYNSRPINGTPRAFRGATAQGVTVTFNGEAVSVATDGTFAFAVPFQALENCSTLVLTDESTGLSTVYAFYSFGYGVSGGFTNVKVYDEEGNAPGDKIQEASLSGSITRFSSSIDKVRVGFDGSAAANQECVIDLTDGNGRVLQSFTTASGDKATSQTFLSDVIQLKKGTNCLLLRYHGVDKSKWEDGKPVETPAYRTMALVINYVDPNDNDPALKDTELEKVELYIKGIASDAIATEPREIEFQWAEKTETTPARWESTVELSPEDFDLGKDLEYLSQVIHLRVKAKDGQEITVTGGNEIAQPRTLLSDGSYHVADYYESFGSADKPTVMKKDSFTVTINVTAKNGIDKAIYFIKVNKSGKAALIIPMSYRSRELTITDKNPIRTQQLTFNAVSITDAEGLPINTARALEDGTLKIEFLNPEVASWDGKTRNGDNLTVSLLAQGKTEIKLTYDDGELHLEGTAVLYVNYTVGMLADARSDAFELWADESRQYEEGAKEALLEAYRTGTEVYDKYKNKDRRLMDQTQFDEINDAVNALRAAIDAFKHQEIGIKIVEFPGWPEDYDLPESVLYNEQPSNFTPKTLIGKDAEGKEHEIRVTWMCKPGWDVTEWAEKNYTFTAVLEPGYVPADGVDFPTFVVLKGLRPLKQPLSKDQVMFPSACQTINREKTKAILNVYVGTTLEEIYNPDNPNGKPGAPGLGLETSVKGGYTTWLPTEWLTVPDDFDSSQTSEESGKTFEFQFTLKPGSDAGWVDYDWSDDVPEDQKIYTMIVQIIDPPTLTVTGLENSGLSVDITGTKTDRVFGESQDPVQIDTITLGPDNWRYVLSDRGEKLVPLTYEFDAPDLTDEGYIAGKPYQSGDSWVIEYTKAEVEELTLSKGKLVLTENGGWSKLQIVPGNYPESVYKTIDSNWGEHQAFDIQWIEKNVYQVTGKETGKEDIYAKYENVTSSNSCTVIVLPKDLTITLAAPSMQVGDTQQLTVERADLLEGLEITWDSDNPDIADVDSTGLVTAKEKGTAIITVTVQTDNGPVSGTCTITVTPADPGGDGNGGNGNGSGNGGGGALNGQTTSGGGDYRDLLTDPLPQQGTTGTTKPNANTAQGTRRPQTGTSQTTGQKSETTADAAENGGSGDGTGNGAAGRVVSVAKGDKDKATSGSAKELAVILISGSVLLAAGIFRGKKRGED